MKSINSLDLQQVTYRLHHQGLKFKTGPFHVSVSSTIPSIARHLHRLYCFNPLLEDNSFIDFHIQLYASEGVRRFIKPQVIFSLDGFQPFSPLPLDQAAAQFEWGLNWCIAGHMHQYLIVHSAVLEKDGMSIILPGAPGSGKSTLCAGLTVKGWRLLSDEMALISISDLKIQPVPRPISLKNLSIDLIRNYGNNRQFFGDIITGTTKGEVCHMLVPEMAVERQLDRVNPHFVIFPKYGEGAVAEIQHKEKSLACMALLKNSFNFNLLGDRGFNTATQVIDRAQTLDIVYPDLDHAVALIDRITHEV